MSGQSAVRRRGGGRVKTAVLFTPYYVHPSAERRARSSCRWHKCSSFQLADLDASMQLSTVEATVR